MAAVVVASGSAGLVSAVMAVAIGEGAEGAGRVIDRTHD